MTRYVSFEIFVRQIEKRGFVVRDLGLVQSALARPETSLFGDPAYPTLDLKGAALTESLARNQPFFDGNKRSAWLGLNFFLELNGWAIVSDKSEAFDYIIGVATGACMALAKLIEAVSGVQSRRAYAKNRPGYLKTKGASR